MTQGTFYLSLSHCHDPHHPSFRSASCPYEDPLSPPDPQFLPLNPPEPHRHTTCPAPTNALSDYRPGKNYLIIGSKKGWCGFLSAPDWMNSYGSGDQCLVIRIPTSKGFGNTTLASWSSQLYFGQYDKVIFQHKVLESMKEISGNQ